jgi:hypothetical protein
MNENRVRGGITQLLVMIMKVDLSAKLSEIMHNKSSGLYMGKHPPDRFLGGFVYGTR